MNDKFIKGIICGTFGSLSDLIIHFSVFHFLKLSTTSHYIAKLIFGQQINNLELLLGVLVHIITGAGIGVLFVYLLDYINSNYVYIKGVSLGLASFILHVVIIPNIITRPHDVIRRDFNEALVDLVAHFVYGIVIAFVFSKTTDRKFIV